MATPEGAPQPLSVAVDDFGAGLWSGRLKQELEARAPLRNVLFSLSRAVVSVEELPIRFLDARADPQLQRLRQFSHSPVAWFRNPFVQLVLVSCLEYEDYKRDIRLRLKAMADTETSAPAQPELLFVYVRPTAADAAAKGPAKVFDAMRKDLNRRRERCVRLDFNPGDSSGASAPLGLDDFDRQLKEALRAGFEVRAAAYAEEVRRLMLNRLDPSWTFCTLFLVKDGLAAMLESAGLLEDALREYAELEACYLEALQSGHLGRKAFGSKVAAEDEAALLWSTWAGTRQAVSQPELPPEFVLRQALFASQARLLLKLHRHAEVAERGLKFVRTFAAALAAQQRTGGAPLLLPEAWSFAGCVSLAAATSRLQAARAEEKRKTDHHGRAAARRGRTPELAPAGQSATSPPPTSRAALMQAASAVAGHLSPSVAGLSRLEVRSGGSSDTEAVGSPVGAQLSSSQPQLDWQLGVLPSSRPGAAAAAGSSGTEGPVSPLRVGAGRDGPAAPGSASLYCLLGKLYCAARTELLRLGAAAGLEVPKTAAAAASGQASRQPFQTPIKVPPRPAPPAAAAVANNSGSGGATQQEATGSGAAPPPSPAPSADPNNAAADLAQVDLDGASRSASRAASEEPPQQPGQQAVAPLRLESAVDLQLDSNAEVDSQHGGVVVQSARGAPGDRAESPGSSPHSSQTRQSSLPRSGSDTQSEAGHVAAPAAPSAGVSAAATAPALATQRNEQNDMRSIERQVMSLLADRHSRSTGSSAAKLGPVPPAAAEAAASAAAAGTLPPWLVNWRLRAALSSQHLFTELFVELSEAAARCYSQCGHLRTAALLRAEVADAMAKAGQLQQAADLYERQCRAFLREGWHALAAQTLPKLAACQLAAGSPGLAHTAAALLSLPPPFRGTAKERQSSSQLLLQAAQGAEGLAGTRSLLPSSPAAAAVAAAAAPESQINLSAVIAAAPPKAAVSRFFGRTGTGGAPVLAPPCRAINDCGSAQGALSATVGDALAVQMVVTSQLPVALPVRDVVLTLAVLQEMTVIHSPRSSPSAASLRMPGTPADPRSSSAALQRLSATQRMDSRPPPSPAASCLAGEDGRQLSLEPADGHWKEHYVSEWQQVEELACSLISISSGSGDGGGSSDSSSSGGNEGPSLRPLLGEVLLPPGTSTLTFLAAPVVRGLYKAVHLRARLHQLPLQVAVHPPKPLWQQEQQQVASKSAAGTSPSQAHSSSTFAGSTSAQLSSSASEAPAGARSAEAILLQVDAAQPRVQLTLMAAGGSLIAGQEQWLGLVVAPERDALHSARLELTWPLSQHASRLSVPRKPSVQVGAHRAVHSMGGDIRLPAHGNSSGALTASLGSGPFLRPEHMAAALLPWAAAEGSTAGSAGSPQLLPATGPASTAASWLLDDSVQQQLGLPLVQEGHAVGVWWRVTAGEVPTAPESVHIVPPAPRHAARQHDARRLGLAADGLAQPAAVLDVPATMEYTSGCQRSHSRVLAAAVRQPFSVHSVARELPSGGVALQCTLTSNMAVPAQLSRVALEVQPGFSLTSSVLDSMGLLPASLAPFGSLTAVFLLAPEGASLAGADHCMLPGKPQPTALLVDYSVESRQQCSLPAAPLSAGSGMASARGLPATAATAAGSSSGPAVGAAAVAGAAAAAACQTPAAEVLDLLGASEGSSQQAGRPGSPTATAAAAAAMARPEEGEEGSNQRQECCFRHLLSLEMPASEEDTSGALVNVRLLGPFTATVGQPTTLCWRLERSGRADQQQQQQASRIAFEVLSESDHWRPLGRRFGGVTLAGHDGAVATVEATWVPLAAGTLPVPALNLQDVNFQEVYDVGLSGSSAITVLEATTS